MEDWLKARIEIMKALLAFGDVIVPVSNPEHAETLITYLSSQNSVVMIDPEAVLVEEEPTVYLEKMDDPIIAVSQLQLPAEEACLQCFEPILCANPKASAIWFGVNQGLSSHRKATFLPDNFLTPDSTNVRNNWQPTLPLQSAVRPDQKSPLSSITSLSLSEDVTPDALLRTVGPRLRNHGKYTSLWNFLNQFREKYSSWVESSPEFWEWWEFTKRSLGRKDKSSTASRDDHDAAFTLSRHLAQYSIVYGNKVPIDIHTTLDANTARKLGIYHGRQGRLEVAMDFLERARQLASAEGDVWQRAKVASGIADLNLYFGKYSQFARWSSIAANLINPVLDQLDILLQYEIDAMCIFSEILCGENIPSTDGTSIAHLELDNPIVFGIPHMDFVGGTLADLSLICGKTDKALRLYQSVYGQAEGRAKVMLATDVIKIHIVKGDYKEAEKVANEAADAAHLAGKEALDILRLQRALVNNQLPAERRYLEISEAMTAAHRNSDFQLGVDASAFLVNELMQENARLPYLGLLDLFSEALDQLSLFGWEVKTGKTGYGRELWLYWRRLSPEVTISFLNGSAIQRQAEKGGKRAMSLRNAEIAACLILNPSGLSSSKLAVAVYGDDANQSTVKAAVSRLREHVSVLSNPYRLGEPVESDLRRLQIALERGFVREALELYEGPLLPESQAPMIVQEREALEAALREGVLARQDPELMFRYVQKVEDDLEVWAALLEQLEPSDPRRAMAAARVQMLLGSGPD